MGGRNLKAGWNRVYNLGKHSLAWRCIVFPVNLIQGFRPTLAGVRALGRSRVVSSSYSTVITISVAHSHDIERVDGSG